MKKIIAGNWKMNGTPSETRTRISGIQELLHPTEEDEIIVFPPAVSLAAAQRARVGDRVALGAQNVYYENAGAFTGEVSIPMLVELGVEYVLVGHSERRALFGEKETLLNKKLAALLAAGLVPVYCIGESLMQRECEVTMDTLRDQLEGGLKRLPTLTPKNFIIAYEPVWAIGTGKTASPEDADETMGGIRKILEELELDTTLPLLYGGSAKPGNAKALLSMEHIDGLLIGGASLEPRSFADMVHWREHE